MSPPAPSRAAGQTAPSSARLRGQPRQPHRRSRRSSATAAAELRATDRSFNSSRRLPSAIRAGAHTSTPSVESAGRQLCRRPLHAPLPFAAAFAAFVAACNAAARLAPSHRQRRSRWQPPHRAPARSPGRRRMASTADTSHIRGPCGQRITHPLRNGEQRSLARPIAPHAHRERPAAAGPIVEMRLHPGQHIPALVS